MALSSTVDRPSVPRRLGTSVVVLLGLILGPLAVPAQAAGTHTVTGTVAAQGGGPLDDMSVELQQYDAGTQTFSPLAVTDTNAQGRYTYDAVPDGRFRVHVVSDGRYADAFSAAFTPPDGLAVPVISVPLGGSMSGTVEDTTGAVEQATIVARPSAATSSGDLSVTTSTDELGRFVLGGLAPGAFTVEIRDDEGNHVAEYYDDAPTAATAKAVTVRQGVDTPLGDIDLVKGASISGTITDSDGSSIEGATVRVVRTSAGGAGAEVHVGTSDDTGRYLVQGLAAGTYTIQFVGNVGYFDQTMPATQTVVQGGVTVLGATVLEKSAELSGAVTDTGSAPLGGILVEAFAVTGGVAGSQSSASATTAGDGSFVLRQLHGGTYRLRASDGTRRYLDRFFDDDITVEGGESADATGVALSLAPVVVPVVPAAPYVPPAVMAKRSAQLTVAAKGARRKATLRITVRARGVTPTGKVRITLGRKTLKTVTLRGGKVTVTLRKQKKGSRTYSVVYSGDSKVRATSTTRKVRIR